MPPVVYAQTLPQKHNATISVRKQAFGLSCEFASATGIIYHFTRDAFFASSNQKEAEKKLITSVGTSANPNIGVRMGEGEIFDNLNKGFGGSDFYGIHAGPFIDLFAKYRLTARPIRGVNSMKQSLSKGRLIMAWINVGSGQAVDAELSYGKTRVIKGEHSVVITGYDSSGFFIMDPGRGVTRKLNYQTLLDASRFFSIPFLEVYPTIGKNKTSYDLFSAPIDRATGLNRNLLKVSVRNGTSSAGKAGITAEILKEFGYKVISIGSADKKNYDGVTIKIKEKYKDFISLIQKDLKLTYKMNVIISADMPDSSPEDATVIIGV